MQPVQINTILITHVTKSQTNRPAEQHLPPHSLIHSTHTPARSTTFHHRNKTLTATNTTTQKPPNTTHDLPISNNDAILRQRNIQRLTITIIIFFTITISINSINASFLSINRRCFRPCETDSSRLLRWARQVSDGSGSCFCSSACERTNRRCFGMRSCSSRQKLYSQSGTVTMLWRNLGFCSCC